MKTPLSIVLLIVFLNFHAQPIELENQNAKIVYYALDPHKQNLKLFWKNEAGEAFKNIGTLKNDLSEKGQNLIFAMNVGMFLKNYTPQGLYIESGKLLAKLDTVKKGYGSFYMQPNGVFYLKSNNQAVIRQSKEFKYNKSIKLATQSGPMLIIKGKIHPKFTDGSKNIHIRNGVGILPDGSLLFAMSKEKSNFYDFASFFKSKGCKNALYLDGFVSRTYLPSKNWTQTDGSYAIIIAEMEK